MKETPGTGNSFGVEQGNANSSEVRHVSSWNLRVTRETEPRATTGCDGERSDLDEKDENPQYIPTDFIESSSNP